MTKYTISALLIFVSTIFMEANNPLSYYANKVEESLSMGRYEDALDYARLEIIDYENNPNGYYQAAISLYALQQPGQSLSMVGSVINLRNVNFGGLELDNVQHRCFLGSMYSVALEK